MLMKMKRNKKGFTLAELLIVIAIIAVLVAIAIPVFTGALDKAQQSADDANIRAAYAQYQVDILMSEADDNYQPEAEGTAGDEYYENLGYPELKYYASIDATTNPWSGTGSANP